MELFCNVALENVLDNPTTSINKIKFGSYNVGKLLLLLLFDVDCDCFVVDVVAFVGFLLVLSILTPQHRVTISVQRNEMMKPFKHKYAGKLNSTFEKMASLINAVTTELTKLNTKYPT